MAAFLPSLHGSSRAVARPGSGPRILDKRITKDDMVAVMLYTSMINVLSKLHRRSRHPHGSDQILPIGEMSEIAGLADTGGGR